MSDSFYDTSVILFFSVVPLVLLLLQAFLSARKRILWSALVPTLWTALGAWMVIAGYYGGRGISGELIIFFLAGDLLLIGITAFIRNWKKKRT
ncbi:MAG: hypothetical protein ACYDEX_22410 [Mobilitalea sp.]